MSNVHYTCNNIHCPQTILHHPDPHDPQCPKCGTRNILIDYDEDYGTDEIYTEYELEEGEAE